MILRRVVPLIQKFVVLLPLLSTVLFASSLVANTAQYIYDDAGRLIRVGDENGNYAVYEYDEVGNLLSITTGTANMNPPVLQNVNSDTFFIGNTTPVVITGQNLFNTKYISSNNPALSLKILALTDTSIKAEANVSSQALPGTATLTVTTFYGSASTSVFLTSSKLSFVPNPLSLTPGAGGNITAIIYPSLGRAVTIQLKSNDPSIVSFPSSVTIPTTGATTFTVNGLNEGVAYISSGNPSATVYVTSSAFTPISGEQLTNYAGPVSVYIDSPPPAPTILFGPVSAYIDNSTVTAISQYGLASVYIEPPGGSTTLSVPASVSIEPTDSTIALSQPVSVKISP